MTPFAKILCTALPLTLALPAFAQELQPSASALVSGHDGAIAGSATLNETPSGEMLLKLDITGVPEGTHGVHLHETGDCTAPDFESAGGHIAGDREHGVLSQNGPHPGDLPNVHVGADGVLEADVILAGIDIDGMIFDDDGAAFMIHEKADDYATQPGGDAGSRIACGVFQKPE
ncbi:superoxide dismutase family protein [Sulfitobacter aestuarii]